MKCLFSIPKKRVLLTIFRFLRRGLVLFVHGYNLLLSLASEKSP